jgi:hypothetical protein
MDRKRTTFNVIPTGSENFSTLIISIVQQRATFNVLYTKELQKRATLNVFIPKDYKNEQLLMFL